MIPVAIVLLFVAVECSSQSLHSHSASAGVDAAGRLSFEASPDIGAERALQKEARVGPGGAEPLQWAQVAAELPEPTSPRGVGVVRREDKVPEPDAARKDPAGSANVPAQPDEQRKWPWHWLSALHPTGVADAKAGAHRAALSSTPPLAAKVGEEARDQDHAPKVTLAAARGNRTEEEETAEVGVEALATQAEQNSEEYDGEACHVPGPILDPIETKRSYSSVYGDNRVGTGHARSMLDSVQAWSPKEKKKGEWMQIDLGKTRNVYGTVVQGRANAKQWVTKYKVSYSIDDSKWHEMSGFFVGSTDQNTRVINRFVPVTARYVRISPEEWLGYPSMRAAVLGCQECEPRLENPPEISRSYSSTMKNALPGHPKASSMLNSSSAWVAGSDASGSWMQIALDKTELVSGTVVQGMKDVDQWVTEYKVSCSVDGQKWEAVPGNFHGSLDSDTNVKNAFVPVKAKFVRIQPKAFNKHIAMRAALLVCKAHTKSGKKTEGLPQDCEGSTLNPPEILRKYSSVAEKDTQKNFYRHSKLGTTSGAGAWSPEEDRGGEWLQMDMHEAQWLKGTIVEGRADMGQWVSKYRVAYSVDGNEWNATDNDVNGSTDDTKEVRHEFEEPIFAKYVRIYPKNWHNKIALRAAVIGCKAYDFDKVTRELEEWAKKLGWKKPGTEPVGAGNQTLPPVEPAPIDCEWGEWDQWTDCTTSCGFYGTQRRQREIKVYPQNGGKNCEGERKQQQECNRLPCPVTTERPPIVITPAPTPAPAPRQDSTKVVVVPIPPAPASPPAPVVIENREERDEAPPPMPPPSPPVIVEEREPAPAPNGPVIVEPPVPAPQPSGPVVITSPQAAPAPSGPVIVEDNRREQASSPSVKAIVIPAATSARREEGSSVKVVRVGAHGSTEEEVVGGSPSEKEAAAEESESAEGAAAEAGEAPEGGPADAEEADPGCSKGSRALCMRRRRSAALARKEG